MPVDGGAGFALEDVEGAALADVVGAAVGGAFAEGMSVAATPYAAATIVGGGCGALAVVGGPP